jgi:hypothetical protein
MGNEYVTPSFVSDLLHFNPQLAVSDFIWSQEKHVQQTFFDALLRNQSNDTFAGLFPEVIQSMIKNGNDLFAEYIVHHFKGEAVAQALRASESTGRTLPTEWEHQATGYTDAIISHAIEGKISNYKLTLLLKVANNICSLSTTNRLVNLIERINKIQNSTTVRLNCIVISNCFKNEVKDSGRIFSRLFQRVHDLSKTGNLNASDWEIVFNSMPKIRRLIPHKNKSWFFGVDDVDVPSWDRCELMRRAMLECFVQYNWAIDFFFESILDNDTLKRTAKFAVKSDVGFKFIMEVVRAPGGKKHSDHIKTLYGVLEKKSK